MAANRVAVFLANLREIQWLDPAVLDEVARSPAARGDDPMPLARGLIERGLLTPYQVNQLCKGSGKELVVGPYRLIDRLGEGGMGTVFKAIHATMGRVVALKIIRKDKLAHPTAVKRFLNEVQVAAKLVHPNIVVAFDAGQINDTHYFAMEYVDGIDLSRLVKTSGPLQVAHACECVRQAAQGLQHAHERGLVHRDIKPSNLLLSKGQGSQGLVLGAVKILDMGLARLNEPDQANALTRIGTMVGTPEYLAPEQAKDSHAVDIRADLYSLGCTFYYLLTGKAPFKGSNVAETLMKHRLDEPVPLDQVRPDAPLALSLVLKKLLAKKPEDRYQTPADLVLALTSFGRNGAAITPAARPTAAIPVRQSTAATSDDAAFTSLTTAAPSPRRPRKKGRLLKPVAVLVFLTVLAGAALAFRPQIERFIADLAPKPRAPSAVLAKNSEPPVPDNGVQPPESEPLPDATLSPTPKPQPKTDPAPKPAPKPPVKPRKPDVPDAAQLAEAEKTIRATYRVEFGRRKAEDMVQLAGKLMDDAVGTKDDAAVRFVLLREARDLGALAGNMETMYKAIDELDKAFAIDALDTKIVALDKASKAPNVPAAMRSIVAATLKQVEEAVDADNYDAARRLIASALTAARKANSTPVLAKVQNADKELAEISKEFLTARPARDKVATDPDDESSFKWGRFLAFFKGHWGDGLPFLADGSDEKLLKLAQKDQANPKEPAAQLEVGDAWYALGEADKNVVARKNLWLRAKFWYDQAGSSLSGFKKSQVDQRLKEITTLLPKEEPDSTSTTTAMASKPKNEFDDLMQRAQYYYRTGRYSDAAATYRKALALEADNPKAQLGLKHALYAEAMARGRMYATQGNYKEAANEFRKALDEMPSDSNAEQSLTWAQSAGNNGGGSMPPRRRR